jgi:hypothetical protein
VSAPLDDLREELFGPFSPVKRRLNAVSSPKPVTLDEADVRKAIDHFEQGHPGLVDETVFCVVCDRPIASGMFVGSRLENICYDCSSAAKS